jgi:hypothetical protein
MHKAVLAAVAAAALFAPAAAQQMNQQMNNGQTQTGQQSQMQQMQAPEASQVVSGRVIAPELLSDRQIRDIQQALEARGARQMRMDGRWGADMEAAIMNFQKMENLISQNGELDHLTLAALGLDPLNFGLSAAGDTTGQAPRDRMQDQEHPMHEQPIREQER